MDRQIEKNKTYRIRNGSQYNLFHVLEIGQDTLKLKDLKTDLVKDVKKAPFQKALDAGNIYVSAEIA